MAARLDDLLRRLGVDPDRGPEAKPRLKWETGSSSITGLPPRFLQLLERDARLRQMFEGRPGNTRDRTPSGRDMVLGHCCRRFGFTPDEVRRILQHAPYPVGGGRTEDYLRRTVGAIFAEVPKQAAGCSRNITEGFGKLPARLLDGTWANLSFKAAKLYAVLVIRCMRPSGIVRDSRDNLGRWAGIGVDSVSEAARELEAKGLIRRKRHPHGMNWWVNDLTFIGEKAAYVAPSAAEESGTGGEGEGGSAATGAAS